MSTRTKPFVVPTAKKAKAAKSSERRNDEPTDPAALPQPTPRAGQPGRPNPSGPGVFFGGGTISPAGAPTCKHCGSLELPGGRCVNGCPRPSTEPIPDPVCAAETRKPGSCGGCAACRRKAGGETWWLDGPAYPEEVKRMAELEDTFVELMGKLGTKVKARRKRLQAKPTTRKMKARVQ